MDWMMVIVLLIMVLVLLVYMIFDKYLSRGQEEYYDKLLQQEQMDRIEQAITEGRDKMTEIGGISRNEQDFYGPMADNAIPRTKYIFPNPKKWIEKDNVKTNAFNNQFIAHNTEDETELQCVACGSFDVETTRAYGDSRVCTMKHECEICGNQYTVKGE